jgi:hypothetical protein
MAKLNAHKQRSLDLLDRFLDASARSKPQWSEVHKSLDDVAKELAGLLTAINNSGANVIRTSGLRNHSELLTALARQQAGYGELSYVSEPKTDAEIQSAREVAQKLHELYDKVLTLEDNIDNVARSHTPGPN